MKPEPETKPETETKPEPETKPETKPSYGLGCGGHCGWCTCRFCGLCVHRCPCRGPIIIGR